MLQEKKKKNTFVAENAENMQGEMLEWLKRHAWKACKSCFSQAPVTPFVFPK